MTPMFEAQGAARTRSEIPHYQKPKNETKSVQVQFQLSPILASTLWVMVIERFSPCCCISLTLIVD